MRKHVASRREPVARRVSRWQRIAHQLVRNEDGTWAIDEVWAASAHARIHDGLSLEEALKLVPMPAGVIDVR